MKQKTILSQKKFPIPITHYPLPNTQYPNTPIPQSIHMQQRATRMRLEFRRVHTLHRCDARLISARIIHKKLATDAMRTRKKATKKEVG